MRKKTLIYLILFLLIAGFAAWLLIKQSNTTVKGPFKDFAVKDTAAITKIYLVDRYNTSLLLERKAPGYWTANGAYKADNRRVNQLLECIRNVEMRSPVPKANLDNIIKSMAAVSIKVEIYEGAQLVKTYYVGDNTQDELSTYMLLDNSTEPFIMWLPYFHGYLNIRYMPQVMDWRDKTIFTIPANEIKNVVEVYPSMPDSSFALNVTDTTFTVSSPSRPGQAPAPVRPSLAKKILISFKNDYLEQFVKFNPHQVDSISKAPTYADLIITSQNGKKEELRIVLKKADQGTKVESKDMIDEEKYFGFLNGSPKDLVILQKAAIQNCLGTFKDFR